MSVHPATSGSSAPVTVIGGGIIGCLSAWQLCLHGLAVRLIDPDFDALCCSTGNAGSISAGSVVPLGLPGMWKKVPGWLLDADGPLAIRPDYALQIAPWLLRFLRASGASRVAEIAPALLALNAAGPALYRDLVQQLGAPELLRLTGQLQVYSSAQARAGDALGWRLRREHGVEVEEVDAGALHELEPAVAERFTHGVFLPGEGMVTNPQRLLRTLRQALADAGVELLQARVEAVQPNADGHGLTLQTTAGPLAAAQVVLAAGAWSHQLARQLGDRIPLQPQRGYHVVFATPGVTLQRPVVAAEAKCFATPMEMGLRVAGTVEFGSLQTAPNRRRVQGLLRHSRVLFPQLQREPHTEWMGNRPCLPDSLPVIGRARDSARVVYAFGHGHLGLTQAPVTAQLVCDLVLGRKPQLDLSPYRADRF